MRLWTEAPAAEKRAKIWSIDYAVVIHIRARIFAAASAPRCENHCKVHRIDNAVEIDVAGAWVEFADVRDSVGIRIDEFSAEDLAVVHDAVGVAVGGPFDETPSCHAIAVLHNTITDIIENLVAASRIKKHVLCTRRTTTPTLPPGQSSNPGSVIAPKMLLDPI